jgi:hypothetical protein
MSHSKKVILLGFPDAIKLKSKKYIIETLYNRAKKNPFLADKTYEEYIEFLLRQIDTLGPKDIEIDIDAEDIESKIYDVLKEMKWLKVINAFLIGVITTNIGV